MRARTRPSRVLRPTLLGLAAWAWLGFAGAGSAEDGATGWLKWRNGDELRGAILQSDDGAIRWEAEPFAAPLEIRLDQLDGIRFSTANRLKDEPQPRFRVLLNNGDRLEGDLLAIGEGTLKMSCPPFAAPFRIRIDAIERVIQASGDHLQYSGPDDLEDWSSTGRDREPTEWFTDLRGEFATHQWSGNLFREIELPEKMELSFSARFPQGKPNLEIGLVRDAPRGPMIETWDNYLVLTYRTRFVPVLELTEETRSLDFRLFWDQSTGDLRLCEPSGKLLASLDDVTVERGERDTKRARSKDPLARGFSILNRTPELKLTSLTVREWDGVSIPLIDLSQARLHLRGREPRFRIDDVSLTEGSSSLTVGNRQVPLGDLQELIVSPTPDSGEPLEANSTRIAWFGGSTASGDFERVGPEELVLSPSWSEEPVRVVLADAKEVRFPEVAAAAEKGTDLLTGRGFSLRGTTKAIGNGNSDSLIGWRAPGSSKATPLADGFEATINRDPHPATAGDLPGIIGRARLYLVNDEVLVGDLISIEPERVRFSSPITGRIEVATGQIRAIDIGSAGRVLTGFRDSQWEEIEDSEDEVTSTPETVNFTGGSFGNPSLLLGDRIHFDAEWKKSYGAMTLKLFAASPQANTPSTDIIIASQGNRLFIGKLKESGAFSFSGDQIPITGNSASFEIRARPEKVEVIVNGKTSLDLAVDPENVSGNGIYFKMGGGWQGWNQADNEIEISDFRIDRSPGSLPRRVIDPAARQNALSIPRTLRDSVPTHLLIAPNGDLLRGNLLAASGDSVKFASGEATLDLPRSRVSAIVWLRQPAEDEEPDTEGDELIDPFDDEHYAALKHYSFKVTHQFVLMDGSRLQLAADRVDGNRFVGESSLLGTCRIPIENVRDMKRGPATPVHRLEKMDVTAYDDWEVEFTPEPDIPNGESGPASPLVGKEAPPVKLTMLDDSNFDLEDHRGTIVVLDFWATWCGPCIKAMPDVVTAVGAFPDGAVTFRAVNQAETPPIISDFLKKREWDDTPVALDFDMKVSRAYGVEGIPHTVVIGRDGKVAWVHSGYTEELKKELFEAIAKELAR
ncbi:MAG: TlpA disulfide reductase family protein [Verrucomicrobiales bacterium]